MPTCICHECRDARAAVVQVDGKDMVYEQLLVQCTVVRVAGRMYAYSDAGYNDVLEGIWQSEDHKWLTPKNFLHKYRDEPIHMVFPPSNKKEA